MFDDFSAINRERCESPKGFNHELNSWSLSDWITATLGELGEAANVAKKLNRIRDGICGNKVSEQELRENLKDEIADAYIYLDLLSQSQGFNLKDAVIKKFNEKSEEINCPIRYELGRLNFNLNKTYGYVENSTSLSYHNLKSILSFIFEEIVKIKMMKNSKIREVSVTVHYEDSTSIEFEDMDGYQTEWLTTTLNERKLIFDGKEIRFWND